MLYDFIISVIQGAIQRATSRISDVEYRRKIVNCLTDVMSNRLTMTAAHQLHFKVLLMGFCNFKLHYKLLIKYRFSVMKFVELMK